MLTGGINWELLDLAQSAKTRRDGSDLLPGPLAPSLRSIFINELSRWWRLHSRQPFFSAKFAGVKLGKRAKGELRKRNWTLQR